MNIKSSKSPLSIYAGSKAYAQIKSSGLSASDIKVVAGAAGGPKWLVLHGLDQFIFGNWLAQNEQPVHLIGSSIGAWRYAAYCKNDFQQAFNNFEEIYFAQRYTATADKREITAELEKILDSIFSGNAINEILENERFKLNVFADRSRGIVNNDHPAILIPALLLSTFSNLLSRKSLNLFFKRTLFHHPKSLPPFMSMDDFPTDTVPLSNENLRLAILASGSIPLIVDGIDNIPGAAAGYYRDGGLIDYHMSLPYGIDEGIVLLPHFSKTITPGWLDKYTGWRKPKSEHLKNVLMIAPSDDFINSLPLSKIPDRTDFKRFVDDDTARLQYWSEVTKRSEELSQELNTLLEKGSLIDHITVFD